MCEREYESLFEKAAPVCSVVEDRECLFPANLGPKPGARITTCHACGNDVCTATFCSRRTRYYGKRRRLCAWCFEENAGMSIGKAIAVATDPTEPTP